MGNHLYQRRCVGMKAELYQRKSRTFTGFYSLCCLRWGGGAGWRRHGDRYPEHLVLTAALRVEAGQLSGGSHVIGKKTRLHGNVW